MNYEIKESGGDYRLYREGKDVGRAGVAELQFWQEREKLRQGLVTISVSTDLHAASLRDAARKILREP